MVYAYAGCYTTPERHGRGDGIQVYRVDPEARTWTHVERVGNLVNPSFLVTSRDQRFLYSVHGDERYASSFAVDAHTGHLTFLNQADTGGTNGVHQALSADGRFLVVANYASGSVAVLPVQRDGRLGDHVQLAGLEGKPGPHRTEQTSSHPHHVVFDPSGRYVLVPDKGLDRVFVFHFDEAAGKLSPTERGSVASRAGSGPRHLAFHPTLPVVWVLNELASTAAAYSWDAKNGALQQLQIVSSLPPDFTAQSSAAEIAVSADGRFVYCSNRGHDSIAIFRTNQTTGLLASIGWTPTQGKSPRFIGFDPGHRFLYAANQEGDNIAIFRPDPASGRISLTGRLIANRSPVTIAFAAGSGTA
jgi:6-phosphogluconolactonase (cycloisomerase 2 family)